MASTPKVPTFSPNKRKLRITLLSSEWGSLKGISAINRELAIHLAKHTNVEVSVYVPQCSKEEKAFAASHHVNLIEARKMPGFDPIDWMASVPKHHEMDCVIGHGVHLGRQVLSLKRQLPCKWVQFLYTAPQELGMYKHYADAIYKGEENHQLELQLCELADQAIAVGPKVAEAFSSYLRSRGKSHDILSFIPSIFTEFANVKQSAEQERAFRVLVFGTGDNEDFWLKGYDIAAQAIAELKDVVLVFIGAPSGKQKQAAEVLLRRAGISPRQFVVRSFHGEREQLARLFIEVDLVIMTSRTEGFGVDALQALSAGLPVLVSDNSGLGQALLQVPAGSRCVVHSQDPKEWAKAILSVSQKDKQVRIQEAKLLCEAYAKRYSWQNQCDLLVERVLEITSDSSIPPEIRARGPRAELAYQKAMLNGKVEVYRGRIMLLGQARAGKTSLKKSLLGMRFDPEEESTIGIDPSKCEVELDEVKNWKPTEGKKPLEGEVAKDIARLMAKDLNEAAVNQKDMHSMDSSSYPEQTPASLEHADALPTADESTPDTTPESNAEIDIPGNYVAESTQSKDPAVQRIRLKIDTNPPKDVTEQLLRYLKGLELEDETNAKEITLTLWDFAGQHLYYASHSVFLSTRAVYVLVYNLSKRLSAQAEPCARQGIHDIVLDNPNDDTNLDNLLSWLVSVHSIRPTTEEAGRDLDVRVANLPYLRPPVLIVGTHADLQSSEDIKKMEECIQKSIVGTSYERHVIRPFFAVDNTNSQVDLGIQNLQKKIIDVVKQEPYLGEEVPLRWFNFEKVVEALVSKKVFHMNLGQLQTVTREVCRIDDNGELTAMLNFYHDLGVIVKHGQTVVLQAQWLIDLFKQLITVRPFHEMNPLYSKCWYELQERGILRMALVDHVFKDFIQKGLLKQDILDMMELYGLIAKFSCSSSESEQEQRYFVPAQLTSSPSGLCEIKPSECDPCPLYLHFLDDFVPHGLFTLLLSRIIVWCSRQGLKEAPQLYHNGARFFIGMQIIFDLILICRKRFIKVILKRRSPTASGSSPLASSTKMAGEVCAFLERTIHGMSCELPYLRNIRYEMCVACTLCLQSTDQCGKHKVVSCAHDDCLHLLPVRSEEELICAKSLCDETVKVYGLNKWLQVHKAENDERKLEFMTLEDNASLKCGTPSTDDLLLIAHELGSSWKMFGRALHLDEPVLEQIEEDERRLIEKCYGVLRKWLECSAPNSTYKCLAEALEQSGRSDLAAKYCDACSDSLKDYAASTQSLTLKSGTPSSDELLDIATEFCSSWKMFSRALHLREPVVAQIEEEELKLVSKCYAVLLKWSENFGSEATYQCLAKALQHPVVGQSHLVIKLCTL